MFTHVRCCLFSLPLALLSRHTDFIISVFFIFDFFRLLNVSASALFSSHNRRRRHPFRLLFLILLPRWFRWHSLLSAGERLTKTTSQPEYRPRALIAVLSSTDMADNAVTAVHAYCLCTEWHLSELQYNSVCIPQWFPFRFPHHRKHAASALQRLVCSCC